VRLIRSKGVGVFFITQNPLDIPETVLGQLGNRVQHALRAYTPRDQKAVKSAAETFRPNPAIDVGQAITELGVGEALVSFLDEKGTPQIVQRAFVLPPASQLGPVTPAERQAARDNSVVAGVYEKTVDRESAYEKLTGRVAGGNGGGATTRGPARTSGGDDSYAPAPGSRAPAGRSPAPAEAPADSGGSIFGDVLGGLFGGGGKRDTAVQAMVKSAARSIGSQVGREIIRGVLGSILKRR